jgi:hypothetical protein
VSPRATHASKVESGHVVHWLTCKIFWALSPAVQIHLSVVVLAIPERGALIAPRDQLTVCVDLLSSLDGRAVWGGGRYVDAPIRLSGIVRNKLDGDR